MVGSEMAALDRVCEPIYPTSIQMMALIRMMCICQNISDPTVKGCGVRQGWHRHSPSQSR